MFLNQRAAEFSFFYTKRSSSTYTFKLIRHYKEEWQCVDCRLSNQPSHNSIPTCARPQDESANRT